MCQHLTPSPVGHFSLLEALTAHAPPLAGTAFTSYRLLRLKNLFLVASFTSLILLPCAELWFQKLPVTCVQMRPHPAVPVQVHLAPPSPPVSTEARRPPTPVSCCYPEGDSEQSDGQPRLRQAYPLTISKAQRPLRLQGSPDTGSEVSSHVPKAPFDPLLLLDSEIQRAWVWGWRSAG